jgi:hypothetical protein
MNVLLNDEAIKFLNCRRLPGRLNVHQVAAVLGFSPHDIPVLVARMLLKPLGKPVANSSKYFAARDTELLSLDPAWLSKASSTMMEHWQGKNGRSKAVLDPTP